MAVSTAELKVMLNATDNMSGVIKSASGSLGSLESAATTAGKALLSIGAIAGAGLVAGLSASVKSAADFESTMSGVKAVSGATGDEMKSLTTLALKLGADTKYSATEAGQGIEELIKAGVSVADVMGGAATASLNLAAAGEVSVAEAAVITSNALNAFGLTGADATNVANLLAGASVASATDVHQLGFALAAVAAVAHTVGVSFPDTNAAIALFAQNGLKGSDAGTSLKTALLNLNPATDKQKDLFDQLGITTNRMGNKFFDAQGNFAGLSNMAEVLRTATEGMTKQQKLATLEMIGGSDAVRALSILSENGAVGVDKMKSSITEVGDAQKIADERLNNLAGSMEKLKGSVETAAIAVGTGMLPGLRRLADTATEFVNDHMDDFENFGKGVASGLEIGVKGISAFAGKVAPAFAPAREAFETFAQALQGDWAPDANQIAPFTLAVGNAGVALRDIGVYLDRFAVNSNMAGTSANDFKTAATNLTTVLGGLHGAIASVLSPMDSTNQRGISISATFKELSAEIVALGTAFNVMGQSVGLILQSLSLKIQAWGAIFRGDFAQAKTLIDQSTDAMDRSGQVWSTAGQQIMDAYNNAMKPAIDALPPAVQEMNRSVEQDFAEMATDVGKHVVTFQNDVISGAEDTAAGVQDAIDELLSDTSSSFDELSSVVAPGLAAYDDAISEGMDESVSTVQQSAPDMASALDTAMGEMGSTTIAGMEDIAGWVSSGMDESVSAVTSGAPDMTAAQEAAMTAMNSATADGMATIVSATTDGATNAVAGFSAGIAPLPDEAASAASQAAAAIDGQSGALEAAGSGAGQAAGDGMVNGILSRIGAVLSAGARLGQAAIDALRGPEGIDAGSPSKKTHEAGEDFVQGFLDAVAEGKFGEVVKVQIDSMTAALQDYKVVAGTIASVETQIKDIRDRANTDALFRAQEMITNTSEELRLKSNLAQLERNMLPARQELARVGRDIAQIEHGSLADRQRSIDLGTDRNKIELQILDLEDRLGTVRANSKEAKSIQDQIQALRDKESALGREEQRITLNGQIASAASRQRREELTDEATKQAAAETALKDMLDTLGAESAVFSANEAVIKNATDNEVGYRERLTKVFEAEGKPLQDRITAGLRLVDQLAGEGKISQETADKVKEISKNLTKINDTPAVVKITSDIDTGWITKLRQEFDKLDDSTKNVAKNISDIAKDAVKKITGKASGGPVSGGTTYLVGENGPELFTPWMNGSVLSNESIRSAASGAGGGSTSGGDVINISIAGPFYSADDFEDRVVKALDRADRRGRVNSSLVMP